MGLLNARINILSSNLLSSYYSLTSQLVGVLEHEHGQEDHDKPHDDRPGRAEMGLGRDQNAYNADYEQEQRTEDISRTAFSTIVSKRHISTSKSKLY